MEDIPYEEKEEKGTTKKAGKLRLVIILALIGLGCAAYFIWRTPSTGSSATPILSQTFSTNTNKGNSSSSANSPGGSIQVYVTGAVQNPGVYTLSGDARMYQLLKDAGGPLPSANLIALNLAAKLVDGEEVYVSKIGETPPIIGSAGNNSNNQGQLVNINTASAVDLEQKLHLSTKSAQDIINYRQQHGNFTAIDELLQVVSQSIYNKIKNQITV
jgi:competence protein ComEA